MAILIKKRVSLDFLGDEYKDGFLTFSSIPMSEYESMNTKIKELGDDNEKALIFMREMVAARFIEGKFPNEKGELVAVAKEELSEFPAEVFLEVMGQLNGKLIPN